ncbi:MAG TPA: DNA recombination protein RmuC [Myxococcaceae bacterium]|nr:DNA recombination protein RmuC [Myxococcaceae bacterium]
MELSWVAGTGALVAAAAAAVLGWVLGRARLAATQARERATLETSQQVLAERVRARDVDLQEQARTLAAMTARAEALEEVRSRALAELAAERAARAEEQRAMEEKLRLVQATQEELTERFKALSHDALQANTRSFLEYAKTQLEKTQEVAKVELDARSTAIDVLVAPIREALEKVDVKLAEFDQSRERAQGALGAQIRALAESQDALRQQTERLVGALRAPNTRGRWGEIQLRRVVELAGMVDRCDFTEQTRVDVEGGSLRPDLVVHLPGEKQVVVDSKVPLQAYLDAHQAADEAMKQSRLAAHAADVRRHVRKLSEKGYAAQFESAPEFVVMFMPGEAFLFAALEKDPELVEFGATQNVILATPTTLIALLRAVAYGWRQEQVAKNARDIQALGRELHDRLQTVVKHLAMLGQRLGGSVDAYNSAISSLESRALVTARKFRELGAGGESDIPRLEPVESLVRQLDIPALPPGRRGGHEAA